MADVGDVIAAMLVKPEDKNVQMEGCQALRDALVRPVDLMTYDKDEVANSVAEQGAIPLATRTLHRHMENMGVVEQALGVLYLVAAVHENDRREVVNEGAISITIAALKQHDTHGGIQEQGLQLLATVAKNRECPLCAAPAACGGRTIGPAPCFANAHPGPVWGSQRCAAVLPSPRREVATRSPRLFPCVHAWSGQLPTHGRSANKAAKPWHAVPWRRFPTARRCLKAETWSSDCANAWTSSHRRSKRTTKSDRANDTHQEHFIP